ncbi:DnaJ-domain-containing protein [Obba rivulosa]|uniref:DnaJ-domain-containing protein n=1 Tax=Obba rivulosa TaxID=1052685 RepID=A0A8E2B178_9APHY|nr:DnaJ-domain-containing protein [Obba rivulosa]
MFSRVLSSASSFFHLPIDDDDDDAFDSAPRHILWTSPDATDSDDSDDSSSRTSTPSSPSSSSLHVPDVPPAPPPPKKNKSVIREILSQDDLYVILGVARSSALDKYSLRRAYLTRSKECHPDKFPDDPEATKAFQKVSVAYDVLSKPSSRRSYDSRPRNTPYDFFSSRPFSHSEETFRGVLFGVFNDLLDGDLEMVRSLLRTVNDMNPSLRIGEDGINSVLVTLQSIRERALTCRACILALHNELTHMLDVQREFRELSYFDLRRRSRLTIQLARLLVCLPIALDEAIRQQRQDMAGAASPRGVMLNRRVHSLLRGIGLVLERMERFLR